MTTAAILQPNYVPWRGYFDMMDDVDVFVLLDDVQYTKNDWRNRNRIKTAHGLRWLSVPVRHERLGQAISDVRVGTVVGDWRGGHLRQIADAYRDAPHLEPARSEFAAILARGHDLLVDLDLDLLVWAKERLGIATPILRSSDLPSAGTKTAKLIDLLKAVGATAYLSGPSAEAYIDPAMFAAAGISLAYKRYEYPPYPQLWGPFEGGVSVLDLLFNTGPEARAHLKSLAPHRPVIDAGRPT
jgi:hypothetical protein